ncbi:thermonuclease family protein [Apibacter sp. HY039]|uniref:thermonuclease family protein n=1 Tax=Apibacter sp. HY039 TaxID=2501476 RepID=UPI000FEBFCDB|nr:thermonuclease family protein [Apibacter sp. HY039]
MTKVNLLWRIKLLLLCILFCLGFQKTATLTGKVIKVADGDTITILTEDKKQVKIRLYGIDCPENKQDFGTKARTFTSTICFGKNVTVEIKGIDRYKRTLGIVKVEGKNVNEELLKNGLAWKYKYTYSSHYLMLEQQARKSKLNIWSLKKPIAPWDFRKRK